NFVVEGREAHFELGAHDSSLPLVIDPIISFYLFLGGTAQDTATGAATNPDGYVFVTGWTASLNFLLAGSPYKDANQGLKDIFVTKLYPNGNFFYSTYAGGSQDDMPAGLAVDPIGQVYITGTTYSPNYPVTNVYQNSYGGNGDAFITKVNAEGSGLSSSSYL